MLSQLSIHALIESEALVEGLLRSLDHDRYRLTCHPEIGDLVKAVNTADLSPDCLVVQESESLVTTFRELVQAGTLLPAVILTQTAPPSAIPPPNATAQSDTGGDSGSNTGHDLPGDSTPEASGDPLQLTSPANASHGSSSSTVSTLPSASESEPPVPGPFYHPAEVWQEQGDSRTINQAIDRAIVQFLQLSPLTRLAGLAATLPQAEHHLSGRQLLVQQQQRLAEKLKERLGYLGVYYKRDPKQFLRHLSPQDAQELWGALRLLYREIVLNYFESSGRLNSLIDEFVNLTFFADIPVTNIVELHMELMDEFSKQLKMEGRSEEILLDYRLTLIDTIAHLCEMYRRSIPRDM